MDRAARAFWVARFDIESLISKILRSGTWLSLGLIAAGWVVQWTEKNPEGFGPYLRARSVPLLILSDFREGGLPVPWPARLIHLGVAVLLLTPYVRVAATLWYSIEVERSWKRLLSTGLVLVFLTVILLTNWV